MSDCPLMDGGNNDKGSPVRTTAENQKKGREYGPFIVVSGS